MKKCIKIASVSFDSWLLNIPLNNLVDTESKVLSHAIRWWKKTVKIHKRVVNQRNNCERVSVGHCGTAEALMAQLLKGCIGLAQEKHLVLTEV